MTTPRKIIMYGIKSCDTVKKARVWLDSNGIEFEFVDFKTSPPNETLLSDWVAEAGIEKVVNKRGTTWRKLSAEQQQDVLERGLFHSLQENPSTIKRPVLQTDSGLYFGFKPEEYEAALTP